MNPQACGEAIWQSYAGVSLPGDNALNSSLGDVGEGDFEHKTPEEIAQCIKICEVHRRESIAACRVVYGSGVGDADVCNAAVTQSYNKCVAKCN